MVRASGSYPLCQGFDSLHRHRSILATTALLALPTLLLAAPLACRDDAGNESPEEAVELARARQDSAERLRDYLVSGDSSAAVRLRAIRGLVEAGRIDQLRRGLRQLSVEEAQALVERSLPPLSWLAMAGSVPEGRLRQAQVFAKDALLLLDEWMTPGARREARAIVVRWFLEDLPNRDTLGDVPLARADQTVRAAVVSGATLRGGSHWSHAPKVAAIVLASGSDVDRRRVRAEAAEEFVAVPFGTDEERSTARSGILAALRGLSGDIETLQLGLKGRPKQDADNAPLADLTGLRDALAEVIRSADESPARRSEAVAKIVEIGFTFRPLALGPIVGDAAVPATVRAALAEVLTAEGDGAAAAAAVLAPEAEVFAAAAPELRHVKMQGELPAFAQAIAVGAEGLAAIDGRCEALVEALSGMGPRRSATAAGLLLGSDDPFIMSLGIGVLARVGTPEHVSELAPVEGSRARSVCWPERKLGEQAALALEAMASREDAEGEPEAGDEDGG